MAEFLEKVDPAIAYIRAHPAARRKMGHTAISGEH